MKYLSLFTGIGGFELGINKAHERNTGNLSTEQPNSQPKTRKRRKNKENGWMESVEGYSAVSDPLAESKQNHVCIGFSEIDKYASQIYQSHFPYEQCTNCRMEEQRKENLRLSGGQEAFDSSGTDISHGERPDGRIINSPRSKSDCGCKHKPYGDITKINADDLPDFDLLVGGFPCQAFSIAGKRKGFDDTRGTLFFDIARILRAKRPRLLLLENVKGLLSHDNGRTFSTIISTLDGLGYDLQWQVLNSKNHGVPQNRERVFIVGHLRGTPRPEVFPFLGTDGEDTKPNTGRQADILPTIRATHYKSGDNQPLIRQLNNPTHSNDRIYDTDGVSPTLNAMQGGMRQPFIVAERGRYNEEGKTEQKMEARHDGVTNTLTSVEKDNRVFDGVKIRRLTPTECERLQGFPDGWTAVVNTSDSQRYKTLGNAVTVNVIEDIISKMLYEK